jgi:hypothetical protein
MIRKANPYEIQSGTWKKSYRYMSGFVYRICIFLVLRTLRKIKNKKRVLSFNTGLSNQPYKSRTEYSGVVRFSENFYADNGWEPSSFVDSEYVKIYIYFFKQLKSNNSNILLKVISMQSHQIMVKSQNTIMSTKAISFQSPSIHNIGRPNLRYICYCY